MVLSGNDWFRMIADVFGGWLWMVLGASRWFLVDSSGCQRFAVLVPKVEFVALNLKEVDNCEKFL